VLWLETVVNEKLADFDRVGIDIGIESFKGLTFEAFVEDLRSKGRRFS